MNQTTSDISSTTDRSHCRPFLGRVIGVIGTVSGVALGVLLATQVETLVGGLERVLNVQFLNAEVYFMSDLPADVLWRDVWQVSGVAFVLCALATVYPAWRAARMQPAEVLRHD